jgi:hypothetical protein
MVKSKDFIVVLGRRIFLCVMCHLIRCVRYGVSRLLTNRSFYCLLRAQSFIRKKKGIEVLQQ